MIIRKATFQDAVTLAENQVRMAMESENMKLDYQTVIKGTEAYLNDPGKGTCYIAHLSKAKKRKTTFTWISKKWHNA